MKKKTAIVIIFLVAAAFVIAFVIWRNLDRKISLPETNAVTSEEYFSKSNRLGHPNNRIIEIKNKVREKYLDKVMDDFILMSSGRADYFCMVSNEKFFKVQILEETELENYLQDGPGECVIESQIIGGKAYLMAKMTKGY